MKVEYKVRDQMFKCRWVQNQQKYDLGDSGLELGGYMGFWEGSVGLGTDDM